MPERPNKDNYHAKTLYCKYRHRAKEKAIPFFITFPEFLTLTTSPCYLCGQPPSQVAKRSGRPGEFLYNGVDRIDNEAGYTLVNCAPCCGVCNSMKRDFSLDFFKQHIFRIAAKIK